MTSTPPTRESAHTRQVAKLSIYVEDGRLSIDNNGAENAMRAFVIGRRSWLLSDTPKGAQASAALYSLIETAKEPYDYLRRMYTELTQAETVEGIEALLPWNTRETALTEKRARAQDGEG